MSNYFSFRFLEPEEDKRKSLVLFVATELSVDLLTKAIKADISECSVPNCVYILTFHTNREALLEISCDRSFLSELDSYVGDHNEKLKLFFVNNNGEFFEISKNKNPDTEITNELKDSLLKTGMLEIFKKRRGLITSSPTYHFVKPSGDHCNQFIRASNLLVSTDEVSLLAISLLPHLKSTIKRIYVDTSSISYLVSTAIMLSKQFQSGLPSIESFESYTAIEQRYDFVEDTNSIVIISATTSGSLVEKLNQKSPGLANSQFLTLFYIKLKAQQIGLFDISTTTKNEGIQSFKSVDCSFCKKGSRQIRIVGDQFLPETPTHELLVIKKTDFKQDRAKFFKQFATKGVLQWNGLSNSKTSTREHFYLDLQKVFSNLDDEFSELIEKKFRKHFSLDVNTVVCLNDPGSKKFSNELKTRLKEAAQNINWLTLKDLDEGLLKSNNQSVIVVAGVITSGRTLLDIARSLRSLHKSASITYLVGFSKLPTTDSLEQLRKDLELGGHELIILNKCPMPRIKEQTKTAWDFEREAMQRLHPLDPFANSENTLPKKLCIRYQALERGVNNANKLFLCKPKGGMLKLRPTFAFWSDLDLDTDKATQADVYWTIQSIFHDLRVNSDKNSLGSIYHTTLISPACFDRYNDGIIQASILRSANPAELCYAINSDFSRKMTDIICSIIERWNQDQGEAVLEFLIAIWTGRMQLEQSDINKIANLPSENMSPEMQFLLGRLKQI